MHALLLSLILCAFTLTANGLKCYDCVDAEPPVTYFGNYSRVPNGFCDYYDDSLLKDCPDAEVCVITDTRIGALSIPFHGCGTTKDDCTKLNGVPDASGLKQSCTSCDSDKCNGAPDIGILECYECSVPPKTDSKNVLRPCYDFNRTVVRLCPATTHVCVSMEIIDGDDTGYVYGCGTTEEECESANDVTLTNGVKYTCQSCTTNKCNNGESAISALSFINIAILMAASKTGLVLLSY